MAAQFLRCRGTLFFGYSGAIFEHLKVSFHRLRWLKTCLSCTTGLGRCDYLDFLPKQPQGTTKILGTSAFAGTKTPAALKFSSKGATTDCAETPANCPYISGLRAARTAGGWPTKHLPAGRRAGRSDWAERRFRRQPFILLSFSSSKKARKAQETQSYQRFQCIDHTDFNTSGTNASHLLPLTKVGTHSAFGERSHTRAYTPKQGCFGRGWYHYPRTVSHVSETLCGQGAERRTLPLWYLDREVLSKNAESLRDSDVLMRVAVPKASRPRRTA